MMIQSASKTTTSTRVVVAGIEGKSDAEILRFVNDSGKAPMMYFDHKIRRTDNFEIDGTDTVDASIVYWTD